MSTIEIKKSELIDCLQQALRYAGSTEWDVYVSANGVLDIRHNTYERDDWCEIIDLYSAELENDGKYPGYDGYDYHGSAVWIVNNCGGWLPDSVAFLGDDGEIEAKIKLID